MSKIVHARVLALGEFFFRRRSWTPIPFLLLLVFCRFRESSNVAAWPPGLALIGLGEGLRLWSVAVIGKESRTRGSGATRLVTQGPYAYVRNPLYLGNLLLTLGATCISKLLWMLPIVFALYLIQYVPIILWEEHNLTARLGPPYAAYCQRVPRWVPRWPQRASGAARLPYQWRAAFWSERSTLGTVALLLAFMIVKTNPAHLQQYF